MSTESIFFTQHMKWSWGIYLDFCVSCNSDQVTDTSSQFADSKCMNRTLHRCAEELLAVNSGVVFFFCFSAGNVHFKLRGNQNQKSRQKCIKHPQYSSIWKLSTQLQYKIHLTVRQSTRKIQDLNLLAMTGKSAPQLTALFKRLYTHA